MDTKKLFKHIPWVILGIIGAFCLAVVALRRGEHVSALWIVVASVSVYLVAYRYYSLYIAQKVRYRTLWCCLSPLAVTAHLSVR